MAIDGARMAIHHRGMSNATRGTLKFKLTPPLAVIWTKPGGKPATFEPWLDNDASQDSGKRPPVLAFAGRNARHDHRTFAFLLRVALAQATGENEGWFVHTGEALAKLPGWMKLIKESRMNSAAKYGAKTQIVEYKKGGPSRTVLAKSRLIGVVLPNFDADAARRWLGLGDDLPGMGDFNRGLSWASMAKLALTSSMPQQPYRDAAVELCPCPGYRGWAANEVRIRIEGDLAVSPRFARAASIFPDAAVGGSKNRYSLSGLAERPLEDDRSIQEFTFQRSDHLTFALAGLMLKHACFDRTGELVGPGGIQSGRHVVSAFPLGASGTTYNVDAEIIIETTDLPCG